MNTPHDHPPATGRVKYRGKGGFWSTPRSRWVQAVPVLLLLAGFAALFVSESRWVHRANDLSTTLSARYGQVVHVYRHPGSRGHSKYQHIYVNGILRPDCRIPDDAHPTLVCTKPILLVPAHR